MCVSVLERRDDGQCSGRSGVIICSVVDSVIKICCLAVYFRSDTGEWTDYQQIIILWLAYILAQISFGPRVRRIMNETHYGIALFRGILRYANSLSWIIKSDEMKF